MPHAKCNIEFLRVPEAPIIKPQAYLGLRRWQSVIDVAIWAPALGLRVYAPTLKCGPQSIAAALIETKAVEIWH